jgi:hypothetical protein
MSASCTLRGRGVRRSTVPQVRHRQLRCPKWATTLCTVVRSQLRHGIWSISKRGGIITSFWALSPTVAAARGSAATPMRVRLGALRRRLGRVVAGRCGRSARAEEPVVGSDRAGNWPADAPLVVASWVVGGHARRLVRGASAGYRVPWGGSWGSSLARPTVGGGQLSWLPWSELEPPPWSF